MNIFMKFMHKSIFSRAYIYLARLSLIGHFQVPPCLYIKMRSCAKPLTWKRFFIPMQIKRSYFHKVLHWPHFEREVCGTLKWPDGDNSKHITNKWNCILSNFIMIIPTLAICQISASWPCLDCSKLGYDPGLVWNLNLNIKN